ncbi:hypothetical protein BKH41_08590 [Helicobacter sp. 12S02232-10]|uniref:hypothetical protein n=1 Tax=Helicobacter sp. 12S02232-10 TaxID=1476197 RepID=UPI000BA6EF73|nr:hypothetical protein [Helicobacter sp. 12S02232-10]PAF46757.1 hypothetical protein BKH41_08590 [Helicobacter sp. 12S02232-10]
MKKQIIGISILIGLLGNQAFAYNCIPEMKALEKKLATEKKEWFKKHTPPRISNYDEYWQQHRNQLTKEQKKAYDDFRDKQWAEWENLQKKCSEKTQAEEEKILEDMQKTKEQLSGHIQEYKQELQKDLDKKKGQGK